MRKFAIIGLLVAAQLSVSAEVSRKSLLNRPIRDCVLRDVHLSKSAPPVALSQYRGKKAVVLAFICEHCVVANLYPERIRTLAKKFDKDAVIYAVHCDRTDQTSAMKRWLNRKRFGIHLLDDPKGQAASYFGVDRTPMFVLIDKSGVMRYIGSLDDNPGADVKQHYLDDALTALRANKKIAVSRTEPFGCKLLTLVRKSN